MSGETTSISAPTDGSGIDLTRPPATRRSGPTPRTVDPRNHVSRRSFVRGAAAAGSVVTAAVVGLAAPAAAQTSPPTCGRGCGHDDLIVVWRLRSDWGTPRGPHNKTRLNSKASRNAAQYRWALTEQDALDMNLHKCSWAPAEAVSVKRCAFMAIWDHNGAGSYAWRNPWKNLDVQLFDTRCLDHIEDGHALWAEAFGSCQTTETSGGTSGIVGFSSPTGTPAVTSPVAAPNSSGTMTSATTSTRRDLFSGRSNTSGFGTAPTELAFTGSASSAIARIGAALTFAGSGLSMLVHRRNKVQLATVHSEPPRRG